MSDSRLEELKNAVAEPSAEYESGPVRITKLKISNYKFFCGDFELDCNANNVLIYGENGSGKSSVYRALEYLTKTKFDAIAKDKNIFAEEGEPQLEFSFSNGKELIIHSDLEELPESASFVKGLTIFRPMLDYKKLLKVHFVSQGNGDSVNIYAMLKELFDNYPYKSGGVLNDIEDFQEYFETLEQLVNGDLKNEINANMSYFDNDFTISNFNFITKRVDDRAVPTVTIEIDYKGNEIRSYHTFLNEARLTGLAISLYFASIKRLLGTIEDECLKMLVLDDLLISLDMNNRLILLELLKSHFNDFQIFFFTHDKELFEMYKSKIPWEKYEFYLDDVSPICKPIVKKGSTDLERAKEYYAKKEYEPCGLMIRKELEKRIKGYLSPHEQKDKNWNDLDLAGLITKAINKTDGEAKRILQKLDTDRKHILNPLSHNDDRNIYAQEIKTAIEDMEKLKTLLK